jgi:hypothetical protein
MNSNFNLTHECVTIYLSVSLPTYPPTHPPTHLSIYGSIAVIGPWPLFQFLNLHIVGRTPWTGDQPVARPLLTHRTKQTQNKCTQTSMPRVEFEPTIPVFERAKTVHALGRTASVIGTDAWLFISKRLHYMILTRPKAMSGRCSNPH